MTDHITLDGHTYVISKQFAWHIADGLGTLTFDTRHVQSDITALLNASNERTLSTSETKRLANLTHVKNVANAIRKVGSHHDPVKEWGLDGWDAVHGNAHTQDCGCIHHYVFDHHSATNHFGHNRVTEERKHHKIEPLRTCAAHN